MSNIIGFEDLAGACCNSLTIAKETFTTPMRIKLPFILTEIKHSNSYALVDHCTKYVNNQKGVVKVFVKKEKTKPL